MGELVGAGDIVGAGVVGAGVLHDPNTLLSDDENWPPSTSNAPPYSTL